MNVATAGRASALVAIVGVPLALGAIWTARAVPPRLDCDESVTDAVALTRVDWLRGAQPAFIAGALLVLAAILVLSAWRRAGRPGPATIGVAALVAIYLVECAIKQEAFVALALVLALAWYFAWATVPVLGLGVAAWLASRPAAARPLAALAALGWCSLLLGVGGLATFVAIRGSGPLCLD